MDSTNPPTVATTSNGDATNASQEMPPLRPSTDSEKDWRWRAVEILLAETIATAMLMLFGCMGLVAFSEHGIPPLQPALTFGVVVATIIQIFMHITDCHINPAATVVFMVMGKVSPAMACLYIGASVSGSVIGYCLLMILTPLEILQLSPPYPGICVTIPHHGLSPVQALALEFLATVFLAMVICSTIDPRNANRTDSIPLKFCATIIGLSVAVGPYTGASMNPARSFAPALWNGTWTSHWVYWVGPLLGAFVASIFYKAIFIQPASEDISYHNEDVPLNQVKVNAQKREPK